MDLRFLRLGDWNRIGHIHGHDMRSDRPMLLREPSGRPKITPVTHNIYDNVQDDDQHDRSQAPFSLAAAHKGLIGKVPASRRQPPDHPAPNEDHPDERHQEQPADESDQDFGVRDLGHDLRHSLESDD